LTLHTLLAQNFRVIKHLELSLAESATLFYGENGAGKTSILEAIDFLGRGRTFRSRRLAPLLRRGSQTLTVGGTVVEGSRATRLGIQKTAGRTILRCNQEKVESISNHASHLPIVCMHPDSHQLIQGGARNRRNYLDWSAFHVEPGFLLEWRKYNKCLRQRNYILRQTESSVRGLAEWTRKLSTIGESIDQARLRIFKEVSAMFTEYNNTLLPEAKVSLDYYKGWPSNLSLQKALEQEHLQGPQSKTTRWGPHCAEIKIFLNNQKAASVASRGQQKLIVASLMLAQINHIQYNSGRSCVVLLDDLCAELDQKHARRLLVALQALKCQTFITAIEPDQVDLQGWDKTKTFHVKQGACKLPH
jgi:DNA replication and repair protein RecF